MNRDPRFQRKPKLFSFDLSRATTTLRRRRLRRRVIQEARLESSRGVKGVDLAEGKKRLLSLAVELLSDRRILLLDQPLLGLDSDAESLEFMDVLKRLASRKVRTTPSLRWIECVRVTQPPPPPSAFRSAV